MARKILIILVFCALLFGGGCMFTAGNGSAEQPQSGLPGGFVYLDKAVPGVILEMRYASKDNFIGDVIDGYESSRCIVTGNAADALRKVQEELNRYAMSLKIYDAYRPQRAVNHFVRWSKDVSDDRKKNEYYPGLTKEKIFRDGYVWIRSNHSKGSTVDLTIVEKSSGKELDMGSSFDFFGEASNTEYAKLTLEQKAHRLLLKSMMEKFGFVNYEKEWWHFTLKDEPFPDTYFDFPVR